MRLLLTLAGDKQSGSDRTRIVASGSLSIGRGADNDWVLPDPERVVSTLHCIVAPVDGQFVLTDLSSNGVFINGAQHATARNSRVVLTDGDQISLGGYVITVAEVDDEPANRDAGVTGAGRSRSGSGKMRATPDLLARAAPDPLAGDPLAGDPRADPRDGRFGDASPGLPFRHPTAQARVRIYQGDPLDSRFDRRPGPLDPNEDLYRGITPPSQWQGAPTPDRTPVTRQSIKPPRVIPATPPGEIDFDALLGDLIPRDDAATSRRSAPMSSDPPPPSSTSPSLDPPLPSDPLPSVPSPTPFAAPAVQPAEPGRRGRTEAERPDGHGPDAAMAQAHAAFAAFLDGAGVVPQSITHGDPEAALRAAGEIFRAMADGLREILLSRAAIKAEMRVMQTMIRAQGNNALKFAATADDAVVSLLMPKRPGYMDPLAATNEAFADIKSHELAVIAGMQSALLALLRRFDPAALEERLTKGRLDAVLPAARKARYWDAFRLTYGEISREAEDDFQAAFGRSFAKAYRALTAKPHTREERPAVRFPGSSASSSGDDGS